MLDFTQFIIPDFQSQNFIKTFSPDQFSNIGTGEIKYPIIYTDGPMQLLICRNARTGIEYLKTKGSIHKYFNFYNSGIDQNYNDFTIPKLKECVEKLSIKYGLGVNSGYFTGLEFGFNIKTSFDPKTFIENNLIHHKGNTHTQMKDFRGKGIIKQFERTDYLIKFYSKGHQYGLVENLLRVEVKFKNRRSIEKHGIEGFSNIVEIEVLNSLFDFFYDRVKEFCIVDDLNPDNFSCGSDEAIFNLFTHPQKYKALRKDNNREAISKYNETFQTVLKVKKLNRIKNEVLRKIKSKFEQLVKTDSFHIPENPILSRHFLTHSTHYISGKRQNVDAKILELDPDHPRRKKLRNTISNPRNNFRLS